MPPQHAICDLSSPKMAPHSPLSQAYLLTLKSHNTLEKHTALRLFHILAHLLFVSSDSVSSLIFFFIACSSPALITSVFPSVHIVGSLPSKLPSIPSHSLDTQRVVNPLSRQNTASLLVKWLQTPCWLNSAPPSATKIHQTETVAVPEQSTGFELTLGPLIFSSENIGVPMLHYRVV